MVYPVILAFGPISLVFWLRLILALLLVFYPWKAHRIIQRALYEALKADEGFFTVSWEGVVHHFIIWYLTVLRYP